MLKIFVFPETLRLFQVEAGLRSQQVWAAGALGHAPNQAHSCAFRIPTARRLLVREELQQR